MKVGDLVKYNYGPEKSSGLKYWGSTRGDIGGIVDSEWNGEKEVAEILWFNKYGLQRSYKKYLEVISETKNKKVLDKVKKT